MSNKDMQEAKNMYLKSVSELLKPLMNIAYQQGYQDATNSYPAAKDYYGDSVLTYDWVQMFSNMEPPISSEQNKQKTYNDYYAVLFALHQANEKLSYVTGEPHYKYNINDGKEYLASIVDAVEENTIEEAVKAIDRGIKNIKRIEPKRYDGAQVIKLYQAMIERIEQIPERRKEKEKIEHEK